VNNRTRTLAVLNYEHYDRLPIVHFGYWTQTLDRWASQRHITAAQARAWIDGNPTDAEISGRLGFDFNYFSCFQPITDLMPKFRRKVLEQFEDGRRYVRNVDGAIVLEKEGVTSIPSEIDHLLKGRPEWERYYRRRLRFTTDRITRRKVNAGGKQVGYLDGGREYLSAGEWESPYGLYCGSLYGRIRNWLGLVGTAYLQADDPTLFREIIDTVGELCYQCTRSVLEAGAKPDFAHFWEDICYNGGPLINPRLFGELVGPHYRRITDLLHSHGVHLVSLDCDGKIDSLIGIWLENGVNVAFPIEVGTWNASIAPWRAQYGSELRGVGGVRKYVFALDRAAIDQEIERLKPLVELGGYIPCPDHRLSPDAVWENVQYYCERMRRVFG
jgi:hypothetical protein